MSIKVGTTGEISGEGTKYDDTGYPVRREGKYKFTVTAVNQTRTDAVLEVEDGTVVTIFLLPVHRRYWKPGEDLVENKWFVRTEKYKWKEVYVTFY